MNIEVMALAVFDLKLRFIFSGKVSFGFVLEAVLIKLFRIRYYYI